MAKNQSQVTSLDDAEPGTQKTLEAAADASELKGANFDDQLSGKQMMLTVHSSDGEGGKDAVFVSLSGYAYQIPRDKPFKVPAEVVNILQDAKVTHYRNDSNGGVVEDTRQRYAFSAMPVEA